MGLLKIFSGKTPQDLEQRGDSFAQENAWGKAKIEYEKALIKLEKTSAPNTPIKSRLEEKISQTKESLAREHKKTAEDMLEAGFYEDAKQYTGLALELTEEPRLRDQLQELSRNLDHHIHKQIQLEIPEFKVFDQPQEEPPPHQEDDGEWSALLGSLPDEIQQQYQSYGEEFKAGYLALNQGDFENAVALLSKAMEDNSTPDSFIALELATAYVNLEKYDDAQPLLENFIRQRPNALPAYQMLCDIFWEHDAIKKAEALLSAAPPELAESVAMYLLRGETLYQARKYSEAKQYYHDFLDNYEWNEPIARALAKTHEALGEMANARNIYRQIMDECQSCRTRIDPLIKLKYADLCFSSGLYTTEVLELYLSLAQEIPVNAAECYQKISQIYAAQGNETEARRFLVIAEKLDS
jgi:tetratricopeptide (TPR) repeat protein